MKENIKKKLLERLNFVERKGEEVKRGASQDKFGYKLGSSGPFMGSEVLHYLL